MGRWCRIIEAWIWMRSRCSLSFWHFWKEVENFETWYRERRVSISSKTLHFLFLKLNPWNSWQRCSDFANLEDNWCNRGTILNAFCVAQKVLRHKNYKISSYCRFWFFLFYNFLLDAVTWTTVQLNLETKGFVELWVRVATGNNWMSSQVKSISLIALHGRLERIG